MSRPMQGLRVVVTMPPHDWFGGIDFNFAVEMSDEIRNLGAEVFELDVTGFIGVPNDVYTSKMIDELRTFRADVAVSLPNAGYVLLCMTPDGGNVFRDLLQIPTVMLWDHGLLQFPQILLEPLPQSAADSVHGAIQRMRRTLDHPLFFHYSPDRGHMAALERLGVLPRGSVQFFLQPAYPNFVRSGYRPSVSGAYRTRIAFAGNVYLDAADRIAFRKDPNLRQIENRVVARKKQDLSRPLWDLILSELEVLRKEVRADLDLEPDGTFFWRFVHDEIEVVGNTDIRLGVLTGLRHALDYFGNFVEPQTSTILREKYSLNVRRSLEYFNELPLLFMNSDLVVDIINLGYNSGVSPKVMGCLACGGLVLFDYKEDFRLAMGDTGAEIMYRTVDELNALIDGYLSNPRKRRDVTRYLQYRAATEFSFASLAQRVLVDEPVWRK